MSEEDKNGIRNGIDISKLNARTMPTQILASVEEKKNECVRKQWRFTKKDGDEVMLREIFEKMAGWVNKFREVGDVVTQYDPTHVALPWAGVRILLQVCVPAETLTGSFGEEFLWLSLVQERRDDLPAGHSIFVFV